jgi:hypothetical protein
MKKCWLALVGILSAFCLLIAPSHTALAHIVASDGDMSVNLHIDPEDYPVINVPQTFVFIYGSPISTAFDARNCVCTMTISERGKILLHKVVPPSNNYFGKYSYTFKKSDVYKLQLTGEPKISGQFSPFNVIYNIRVANYVPGESANVPATDKWWAVKPMAIIGSAIIFFIGVDYTYTAHRELKSRRKK